MPRLICERCGEEHNPLTKRKYCRPCDYQVSLEHGRRSAKKVKERNDDPLVMSLRRQGLTVAEANIVAKSLRQTREQVEAIGGALGQAVVRAAVQAAVKREQDESD